MEEWRSPSFASQTRTWKEIHENSQNTSHYSSSAGFIALILLAGCESKEQKAVDQAKSQATTTNVPQQVQYVDNSGETVTKTVEPPAAKGQPPAVSTLITPPPPGPKPHSTNPVVTPLNSAAQGALPAAE